MTRRAGITLTESLVALFVAALGMISLLVLFPLGAIQIGQALKDERTAQCAQKAEALMRNHWRTEVVELSAGMDGDSGVIGGRPRGADPYVLAFTDPNDNGGTVVNVPPLSVVQNRGTYQVPTSINPPSFTSRTLSVFPANQWVTRGRQPGTPFNSSIFTPGSFINTDFQFPVLSGVQPSYPVLIDPIGWHAATLANEVFARTWLAGTANFGVPNIPRRTLRMRLGGIDTFVNSNPNTVASNSIYDYGSQARFREMVEYCSLLDDLTYDEGGSAGLKDDPASPTRVERLGRYNWAAIVQRPNNNIKYVANLTILVFENRAAGYFKAGSELQYPRDSGIPGQTIVLNPGSTRFRIYFTPAEEPPPIFKGRWIMDGTIDPAARTRQDNLNSPPIFGTQPIRNANFYRVVSTTQAQDAIGDYLDVEIHPPVQQPLGSIPPAPAGVLPSTSFEVILTNPANGQPTATTAPGYRAQIYVLEGLSEVFQKPALQPQLHSSP